MNFLTIPILAQARHGKDTMVNMLLDCETKSYCRVALADEVKIDCMKHYAEQYPYFAVEFDEQGRLSYPHDTTNPEEIAFRRKTWQVWGTQGRREIFEDIWLWRWANRAWTFLGKGFDGVGVPDVRFFNEALHFKSRGGVILAAQRIDSDGSLYEEPGIDYTHASEAEVPKIIEELADITIWNTSTYEAYKQGVRVALEEKGYM